MHNGDDQSCLHKDLLCSRFILFSGDKDEKEGKKKEEEKPPAVPLLKLVRCF